MAACVDKPKTGQYKVKIPVENSLGGYTLQIVDLPTLEKPETVESSIIKVRLNTRVYKEGVDDQIPKAQFILTKDNVIIPKDVVTAQLFSLYKAMEDLYFFDIKVGVSSHLKYPRVVSLQTKSFESIQSGENNARYDRQSDRINIFITTQDKILPLSFYKSIIAHEHFHAIFHAITKSELAILGSSKVERNLFRLSNNYSDLDLTNINGYKKWNFMFVDMLEEGLADFWSHIITGKVSLYPIEIVGSYSRIVDGSLHIFKKQSVMEEKLNFNKFFSQNIEDQKMIAQNIQTEASNVANLMARISYLEGKNSNEDKARWVVQGISNFKDVLINTEGKITVDQFLKSFLFLNEHGKPNVKTCELVNLVLSSDNTIESCL